MDKIGIKLLIYFIFLVFINGIIIVYNKDNRQSIETSKREIIRQVIQNYFSEIDCGDYYKNRDKHHINIEKIINERLSQ